ncbi:LysR family transcriptional regulator [Sphingomonas sp. MG17]|uniref:LysR family transcriptional regulator n=1 Tax=Sphingomonas tagetis TaxID=2949092 RepID=A0A9X2HJW1_9SPHN|nr:LysR family transcriptional regulator [Sphingomonas tagetis]MCP3731017.1 LysR family transcriptional regulator [Sphingomonas tagetis]
MQFRFLEYFIALAEERHFARAATRCHVTQPTLSAGIANLEARLGKRLVQRDRRFVGLTAEGEAILPHARRLVAGHDEMRLAINAAGSLRGEMRLGCIPAAMPYAGRFVGALARAYPELRVAIRQLTSDFIVRGLAGFELDAGLTYLDGDPLGNMVAVALYSERYCLAVHPGSPLAVHHEVTLAQAVTEPLCLLHQGMQNRRILDTHFARRQVQVSAVATTDSYLALLSMVARGGLNSIVTDSHADYIAPETGVRLIPIADLPETNSVGLLVAAPEPMAPVARAALMTAQLLRASDRE